MTIVDEVKTQLDTFRELQTDDYVTGPTTHVVLISLHTDDYKQLKSLAATLSGVLGIQLGIDQLARAALLRGMS